jgi:hypothetical protein
MPLLMTDMAAGSSAVRQMQQNMLGAKYDEANIAAAADEIQQKDQQAKLETQQKQLDLNKTRLANMVTQAKVDLDSKVQSAIAEAQSDPAYQKASESDQAKMIASALNKAGAPLEASKFREQSAKAEESENKAKISAMEKADDELSKAHATIADASSEQMKKIIAGWTPEQKAAVKSQIPNYNEEDPELLKKQLARLMLNGKGQNMAMQMAVREQMEKMRDDTRLDIARIQAQWEIQARLISHGNGDKEKDNQEKERIKVQQKVSTEERLAKKEEDKAHQATEEAATKYRASGWGDHFKSADKGETWKAAKSYEDQLKRDNAQRSLDQYLVLDPSPFKTQMIEKYTKLIESYDNKKDPDLEDLKEGKKPEADKTPKSQAAPAKGETPVAKDQAAFNMTWRTLKPGEKLIGPDGKTYTKK